jgi:hypothetical protein
MMAGQMAGSPQLDDEMRETYGVARCSVDMVNGVKEVLWMYMKKDEVIDEGGREDWKKRKSFYQ